MLTIKGLEEARREARRLVEAAGLDPYPAIFGVVDYDQLNEFAAYDGFPERYPHWQFGMSYDYWRKRSAYSGWWTYELVLNTNPSIAYLRKSNTMIENKAVMVHVYAHADFFKNNQWFKHTPKDMIKMMHTHAERIEEYMNKHGVAEVESFIDKALSIQYDIDQYAPFIKRRRPSTKEEEEAHEEIVKIPIKRDYMERFVNPPEWLERQRQRLKELREKRKQMRDETELEKPQKDLVGFLMRHGHLEDWQKDILAMIREESHYFVPQMMTRIMNEGWACVVAGTLVFTEQGLIPIEEIVERQQPILVSDGEHFREVYEWAKFPDREIIKVRTRRGFELAGSVTHRLLLADGITWKRLDELKAGDKIRLGAGLGHWAKSYVPIQWAPLTRMTLNDVASQAGVSLDTVIRYRHGLPIRKHKPQVEAAVALYQEAATTAMPRLRNQIHTPAVLHEDLAAFLGYLSGDGHISRIKHVAGFTSGDWEQAQRFKQLGQRLFGLKAHLIKDEGRWRVSFYSLDLIDFLHSLGMRSGRAARLKMIPSAILRSPESVVAAFLRAYFDCDAHAGPQGIILSTMSEALACTTQVVLLNFGVLSRRRRQGDGCWHVHIAGTSAAAFQEKIGFNLARKRQALQTYLQNHQFFKEERWEDEIVSLETDSADVYDLSVADSHRYAAAGFINHNSYWESKIMAEFAEPNEFLDHADMQSRVLGGGVLNPYKLGKLIWEDIKERWDKGRFGREWELCKDKEKKEKWDTRAGLGTEKIFEVRRNYNDITFLDEFFTEDIFEKLNLFAYEYVPETGAYHITSRDFQDVKKKILFLHTNLGRPTIKVATGNYDNKGELLLLHEWNGIGLHIEDAKAVLKNIYHAWGRPVNLKTIIMRKVRDPDPMRNRIHPDRPLTAVLEPQGVMLRYDGENFRELALSPDEVKDIKLDEVNYNTTPQEWIG